MKKMFKKLLSVIMVVVMTLTAAPLSGFVGLDLSGLFDFKAEAATYSGTCGENLKWVIDTYAGVLEINGTGEMTDYPWYKYRSSFDTVKINGAVNIIDNAFYEYTNIKYVKIGSEVKTIGYSAFEGCTGLTDLIILNGLTTIEDCAFNDCDSLASVTIPDSVTTIGKYAFSSCDSLTSISIPNSVTNIAAEAFGNGGITTINVAPDNEYYSSDDYGVLFDKNKTKLIQYPVGNTRTEYTIPDSVLTLDFHAFQNCDSLISITIPNSVTSIKYAAFQNCVGLTNIIIPDSVTRIDTYAFQWCDNLASVTLGNGVKTIGSSSFAFCGNLISITLGSGVKTIDDNAFRGCDSLTSITIPDSVTTIGGEAFRYCDSLTSITIPDSVTSIGNYAFSDCDSLTGIMVEADNEYYSSDDYGVLFDKNKTKLIQYPVGNTRTEYIIPDSVKTIGSYSFYKCDSLATITIPDSVTSIGDYAFYYCDSLKNITIPKSVTNIGDEAFNGCGITAYYSGTQEEWNKISFGKNTGLTGNTVLESNSEKPYFGKGSCGGKLTWTHYTSGELEIIGTGVMYDYIVSNTSSKYAPWYKSKSRITTVTIHDGVTSVGAYAFYKCNGITSITLPDGVTYVGDYAFYGCTGFTDITLPDGVTYVGDYAFYGCTGFTDITLPDGVTYVGDYAFYGCKGIASITFPDSVTYIRKYAFTGCDNLKSVMIPNSVTTIGSYAFNGCDNLSSVILSDNLTTIGEYAFSSCDSLKNITIPKSVTNIGADAFYGCEITAYYSGTQEEWNKISFGRNDGLTGNTVLESNSEKPYFGKGSCGEKLTWTLYASGELEIIGTGAMYTFDSESDVPWEKSRSRIINVKLPEGLTYIGRYTFRWHSNLKSVTIPNSVTSIGKSAFEGCSSLSSIVLSENVKYIDDYAFNYCSGLEEFRILGYSVDFGIAAILNSNCVIYCKPGSTAHSYAKRYNMAYILLEGDSADFAVKDNQLLYYEGSDSEPVIPTGITSIGSNAFKDNTAVTNLELPSTTTEILSGAFSGCTNLERIVIYHTVMIIAADAFEGTDATIVCYPNSYAYQYAVENDIDYELISVKINKTEVNLFVGEDTELTATLEQDYISTVSITWKSSDTSVATVDSNGKVAALSNGMATIYAVAPNGEPLAACSVAVTVEEIPVNVVLKIKNPSVTTVNYGDTLILHADLGETALPEGYSILWNVEGSGVNINPSEDGLTCGVTSVQKGDVTVKATIVDENGEAITDADGNEITASQQLKSNVTFWQKIVSFFKNLFRISRIILQAN